MQKNNILKSIKVIILGLAVVLGVSYVSAAWTNPTSLSVNIPAPITTLNVGQSKGSTTPLLGSLLYVNAMVAPNSLLVLGNTDIFGSTMQVTPLIGVGVRQLYVNTDGDMTVSPTP